MDETLLEPEWEPTHPAEKAAKYKGDYATVGNSDEQILRKLRKDVFSVPILSQSAIHEMFKEIDIKLHQAVYLIIQTSDHYLDVLCNIVYKVIAGNTYGKNIYEHVNEDRSSKPTYKLHEIEFLQNAYKLIHYSHTKKGDGEYLFRILKECCFFRGIYEELIESFLKSTENYCDYHWDSLKNKIDGDLISLNKNINKITEYDSKLKLTPNAFGVVTVVKATFAEFVQFRSKIIAPYLRAAYKHARKTARNNQQMLDNFQNGAIGLVRAISCYSTNRPTCFASVAGWWIKQNMLLSIKEEGNFVKLPVSTWQAYTQIETAKKKLGGEENTKKLSEAVRMPEKKIKSIYDTVKLTQVFSIHKTYDSDEKLTLEDMLACDVADEGSEILTALIREYCDLSEFNLKEKTILALRYGMLDIIDVIQLNVRDTIQEAITQNLAHLGYQFVRKPFI